MSRLRDRLGLIAAAVFASGVVWAMLHYAGQWYFPLATAIAFAALLAENGRLKKRLRELEAPPRAEK
ncbi:hypothetical protein ACEPT7_02460 [Burkholderia ubonensis]|uniref:hypothetical protein n=1 Tax=Burkholderia ubonensis TaxID=101571 RepID=UPI00358FB12A